MILIVVRENRGPGKRGTFLIRQNPGTCSTMALPRRGPRWGVFDDEGRWTRWPGDIRRRGRRFTRLVRWPTS